MSNAAAPHASLERAAGLLGAAADVAEHRGSETVFSDWYGLASQIRLTAAGMSHLPASLTPSPTSVGEGLAAAIQVLDDMSLELSSPDLSLWRWHVHELRQVAQDMEQL